jgi:peptide/nickel transport system substrate-binding protein
LINYYPEANTMVAALEAGELDMAPASYGIPVSMSLSLKNDSRFTYYVSPGNRVFPMEINVGDPATFPKQTGNLALKDQRVRWALANAINRTELNKIVQDGLATIAATTIFPGEGHWWDPNIQYMFNLTYANQVLDQAGYTDRDANGVRMAATDIHTNLTNGKPFVVPKGTRLEFKLAADARWPEEERSCEMVRDWWAKIGVKADISVLEDDIQTANAMALTYDIMWGPGWSGTPDPESILLGFWTPMSLGYDIWTGYTNPKFDQLYQQQDVEANVTKRQQIVWQMQELMYHDAWEVGIYSIPDIQVYNNQTTAGWIPSLGGLMSTYGVLNWRSVHMITAVAPSTPSTGVAPSTPSAGIGWETWTAVAAIAIIIVVAVMGFYLRRRGKAPKEQ